MVGHTVTTSSLIKAIADFSEAIRLNPTQPGLYHGRGFAYAKKGEDALARKDFLTALELPSDGFLTQQTVRSLLVSLDKKLSETQTPPVEANKALDTPHSNPAVVALPSVQKLSPPQVQDRRVALVIGNSAYENAPTLANPQRDAKLIAEVLRFSGFQSVTLATDLTKVAMTNALRQFAQEAESADWAVIYYAGHGMEVGGTNYLIPTDATIAADRDIGLEAVPLEQALNVANRAKRLRLVVLDACRDNPFRARMKRTLTVASRTVSTSPGLARVEPEAGTLVVYAAKDGQQALDGNEGNSPFALAFVKNVKTPGLEVRRLFDYGIPVTVHFIIRDRHPHGSEALVRVWLL